MSKSKYQNDFERFFHEVMDYKILADPDQYEYVEALLERPENMQAVFVDAFAGSGKTSIALTAGYYMLEKGMIDKIIYVRNTVSLRENGFLPGTPEEKEEVYMRPLVECINRIGAMDRRQDLYDDLIMTGQLVATSTSYLRGTDISGDSLLIVDEAQNLSLGELRTVLTRKHDTVKAVVIGSHLQVDTPHIERFGKKGILPFELFIEHFAQNEKIPTTQIDLQTNYRGEFAQFADKVHDTVKAFDEQAELAIKQKEYEVLFEQEVLEERLIEEPSTQEEIEVVNDEHPATAYLTSF